MNQEKGTEIAACWKEFHPEIRSILKKATAKIYPEKLLEKSRGIKPNRVTSQLEPLGFITVCICMPCVFHEKINADENHLGKGEALD